VLGVAFPKNLVLKLRPAAAMNVSLLEDVVDLPFWFVVDDHRWRRRLMSIWKSSRFRVEVFELRDVEDRMDANVGWKV